MANVYTSSYTGEQVDVAVAGVNNLISGSTPAAKATADGNGANIANTYAKQTGTYSEMTVGNAASATKLTSGTVGSSTTPVYFSNGLPAACGNSLAVSITGSAATATNATNATNDGEGNNITNTYAKQNGTYSGMTVGKATIADNLDFPDGPALGTNSAASGQSVAFGYSAKANSLRSVAIGFQASTDDSYSTALGNRAKSAGYSSSALGTNATTSSSDSHTIQLGSPDQLSVLRCRVNLTVTSDKRDKIDITQITKALDFINKLNPVTYVTNERVKYISDEDKNSEDYQKYGMCEYDKAAHARGDKKGNRRRCGLIAQEVMSTMQDIYGSDNYANIVNDNFYDLPDKPENIENQYTLAYSNLIPFLIGAIKEQQVQIEEQKLQISNLQEQVNKLQ